MSAELKKELVVVSLENGTVIDHIPCDKLFKVVSILDLDKMESQITIGNNLKSKKQGKKGIIKISNVFFEPDVINKIALIAPNAKINIIKDYEIVEKRNIDLPDELKDIVHCLNPKCISNNEPIASHFIFMDKKNIRIKCHYCEKAIDQEDINIK